ncbi:MAG: prefoldin subunit alpha [Thaumarchaeota archaeon]|nr:prefoldin subunit alpha [Nitrososphaerota archaeon]
MSEEQLQAIYYQIQMLESYLVDLIQKERTIVKVIQEASSSIESIGGIAENEHLETLVPLGLGAYAKAKIIPNEKMILNIGAGAAIERDKDSTINYIESRIKEMQVALQDTATQKQQVAAKLEQNKQELNNFLQNARKPSK